MKRVNLKTWRERKQFSQEGLARAAGVSVSTIQRYESKGLGTANVQVLADIVIALDINVNQLDLELDKEG